MQLSNLDRGESIRLMADEFQLEQIPVENGAIDFQEMYGVQLEHVLKSSQIHLGSDCMRRPTCFCECQGRKLFNFRVDL